MCNPYMFKSKTTSDPDTPIIKEALIGPYRDELLDGMTLEITELEGHITWTIMRRDEIKPATREDGATYVPKVIPLT
jgi:hypothetical protein